ncbi:Response regulator rcp1 [Neolewinella maritima]|uniref:Response regulator rcp1 n=1 Tax=Neolewinella maritima TaxID=1383882 RepID=A0ABM9AXK7_9BACT|nr:response regulator [Neolewinella maritima]CAH0998998.1 Response regulator rcp1 [Neolewinella maritima]
MAEPSSYPPQESYILYAEDNYIDARFLLRIFYKQYPEQHIVHLENGQLVKDFLLRALEEGTPLPHLVLLDIKMPGLSGLDVLEFIRSERLLRKIPVVILSASGEQRDLTRAYHSRTNAYLIKPEGYRGLKHVVLSIYSFWSQHNRIVV